MHPITYWEIAARIVVSTENDVTLTTITNFDLRMHDMSHYNRDHDWLQTQDQLDRCLDIY